MPSGTRWLLTTKAPLDAAAGRATRVLTVALDVTELRADEVASAAPRLEDPLTGLPSAEQFRARFEHELARTRQQHEMLALLHLDLDRFKGIKTPSARSSAPSCCAKWRCGCKARLGVGRLLARAESDEFLILQTGIKRPDDAAELTRRLSEAFASPFVIRTREIHISASVGITVAPADGRAVETLLKNAELAMYRAKKAGRDAYRFFAAEMNVAARRAVTLERELRQALAAEQFVVHYQPQVELATDRVVGRRGAGALEPPLSRPGPPRRVHRAGRGPRPDRAADRVGAAQRLQAAATVAGPAASADCRCR